MADEDVVVRGTFEDAMHRPLKRLEEQAKDTEKALTEMGVATTAAEVATDKAAGKTKKYAKEIESLDRALDQAALAELRLAAAEKEAASARTNHADRIKARSVAETELLILKKSSIAKAEDLLKAEKAVSDARQTETGALSKLTAAESKLITSRRALHASTSEVTKATKELDKATESLISKFKHAVTDGSNLVKVIGGLAIAGGAATIIQGLAGGIGALGGIAVAAVAGLAPLVGLLGGLPAAVGGLLSVVAVAKIATGGIMGVAKAMMTVTTTSQQMDAAMAALGPGGFVIFEPLRQVTNQLKQIRIGIQRAALPGFASALSTLSPFISVVGTGLTKLAGALGGVAKDGARALASGPWRRDMTLLLDRNVTLFRTMASAGGNIANIFRHIAVAAGPMVQMLAQAFKHGTGMAASWFEAARASGKLEAFFTKSGRLLLGVVGVLRDFGIGLIHVFEAAAPLSMSMGGGLERIAKHFREWTGSKEGQDRMRRFFTDALDTGRHLADALGSIAKSFAELGANAGNGALKNIIDALGTMLPLLAKALNMIANIVSSVPGLGTALAYAAVPLLIAGKVGKAGALLGGVGRAGKWLGRKAGLGRAAATAGEAAAAAEGAAAAGGAEAAGAGAVAAGAGATGLLAVGLPIVAVLAGLTLLYYKWKPFHDLVNKTATMFIEGLRQIGSAMDAVGTGVIKASKSVASQFVEGAKQIGDALGVTSKKPAWSGGGGDWDSRAAAHSAAATTPFFGYAGGRYAGGATEANMAYLMGERGPEAFFSAGTMRIVGGDGAELVGSSAPGFVLPNEALEAIANPVTRSQAKATFSDGTANQAAPMQVTARGSDGGSITVPINLTGATIYGVDDLQRIIEQSAVTAVARAKREQFERR